MYLISSQQEYGYLSDDMGWVYDAASATRFHADYNVACLAAVGVTDARLVLAADAQDFDSDQERTASAKHVLLISPGSKITPINVTAAGLRSVIDCDNIEHRPFTLTPPLLRIAMDEDFVRKNLAPSLWHPTYRVPYLLCGPLVVYRSNGDQDFLSLTDQDVKRIHAIVIEYAVVNAASASVLPSDQRTLPFTTLNNRRALCGDDKVTLDGKPARIVGAMFDHASVYNVAGDESGRPGKSHLFSWEAIARAVATHADLQSR